MNYKQLFEDIWENAIAKGEPFNAEDIALETTKLWLTQKRQEINDKKVKTPIDSLRDSYQALMITELLEDLKTQDGQKQ